jgi:transcriptional regulator with XRE-family HTH domain
MNKEAIDKKEIRSESAKEFINLVKVHLEKNRCSLRELARQCNLDVSFLSKILSGKRNPPSSEKDIRKIAEVLKINSDRLLFAAGRIPSNFQKIFNNENFVGKLISLNQSGDTASMSKLEDYIKPSGHKSFEIEDELL